MSDNLEEEYTKILSEQLQKEIDESISLEILLEHGWTKVEFRFNFNIQLIDDVYAWIYKTYKKDQWKRLSNCFIFKERKHAEWFILRWL